MYYETRERNLTHDNIKYSKRKNSVRKAGYEWMTRHLLYCWSQAIERNESETCCSDGRWLKERCSDTPAHGDGFDDTTVQEINTYCSARSRKPHTDCRYPGRESIRNRSCWMRLNEKAAQAHQVQETYVNVTMTKTRNQVCVLGKRYMKHLKQEAISKKTDIWFGWAYRLGWSRRNCKVSRILDPSGEIR